MQSRLSTSSAAHRATSQTGGKQVGDPTSTGKVGPFPPEIVQMLATYCDDATLLSFAESCPTFATWLNDLLTYRRGYLVSDKDFLNQGSLAVATDSNKWLRKVTVMTLWSKEATEGGYSAMREWAKHLEFPQGIKKVHFILEDPYVDGWSKGRFASDTDKLTLRAASQKSLNYLSVLSTKSASDGLLALIEHDRNPSDCVLGAMESRGRSNTTTVVVELADGSTWTPLSDILERTKSERLYGMTLAVPSRLVILTGGSKATNGFSMRGGSVSAADNSAGQPPDLLGVICRDLAGLGDLLSPSRTTLVLTGVDRWDMSNFGPYGAEMEYKEKVDLIKSRIDEYSSLLPEDEEAQRIWQLVNSKDGASDEPSRNGKYRC